MTTRRSIIPAVVLTWLAVSAQEAPPPTSAPAIGNGGRHPVAERDYGLSAPLVSVDRFSDAAGTLLRRSADPKLPGPNIPFSLDDPPFRIEVTSKDGNPAHCYDLDVRPAKPNRLYVFYDSRNNYRLGQFPVIDSIPGDPGYSDLWDIWKVITPDAFYESNWLRDAKTLQLLLDDPASGFTAASTGIYLNAPIVPEGTAASLKAEARTGGPTQRYYAWYRGKRAPYLYFEGSLRLDAAGAIPVARIELAGGTPVHPRGEVRPSSWPKAVGYSPLAQPQDAKGHPLTGGPINCPIVGTGIPASPL